MSALCDTSKYVSMFCCRKTWKMCGKWQFSCWVCRWNVGGRNFSCML